MLNPHYIKAEKGYTVKEIFTTKLQHKPFDVLRANLSREIDGWLLERDVFTLVSEISNAQTGRYVYRCLYPIRIWHCNGRGKYSRVTADHLDPGDIWTF